MKRPCGLFLLDRPAFDLVYAPAAAVEISRRVDLPSVPQTSVTITDHPHLLKDVELLFAGWGMPVVDQAFLRAAPNLKVIFYAAGAINGWATPAMWDRQVIVTTANDANAIPVAEYTTASILLSLKHAWRLGRQRGAAGKFQVRGDIPGNYKSIVGIVGMGTIARLLVKMLQPFNMTIVSYDPLLTQFDADRLGVVKFSLQELFSMADVVTLHMAELPSTLGMIDRSLLAMMKQGASLINTARGKIINETHLTEVLQTRPDLQAILDVTTEEPLPTDSLLRDLPNVVLTPHIAGSQGRECQRMGQFMVEELDRYLAGQPLQWQVRPKQLEFSVHAFKSHAQQRPAAEVQIPA